MPKNHLIDMQDYVDFCKDIVPMTKNKEDLQIVRIYGHLLQLFAFRRRDLDRWRRMSECDIFKSIWAPIIDIIYEESPLVLSSGDTCSSATKTSFDSSDSDSRGPHKVDLRAIMASITPTNTLHTYDIANCEVAKDGKLNKSTKVYNRGQEHPGSNHKNM